MLFAVVAIGFVAALALPVQFTAAEAATTCKDAAKMDFPNDRKSRRALLRNGFRDEGEPRRAGATKTADAVKRSLDKKIGIFRAFLTRANGARDD